MRVETVAGTALWQETGLTAHDVHWAMIFIGLIAAALVVQAIGVLIAGSFAAKLFRRVDGIASELHERTTPLIDKATALVQELAPKVTAITQNVEQASYTVREKVDELGATVSQLNETVQGINERTRLQVVRVDGIVADALQATEQISESIQAGIRVPIRQVAGVVAGVKAAVETLAARWPFRGRS
jgi:methyl-accepting chemotaxis protein